MRKIIPVFMIAAMLVSVFASVAYTQESIYQRLDRQRDRIDRGVDEGRIRPEVADHLRDNVRHVQHDFDRSRREGDLDGRSMERFNRDWTRTAGKSKGRSMGPTTWGVPSNGFSTGN